MHHLEVVQAAITCPVYVAVASYICSATGGEWIGSLEGPLRDYRDAFERHEINGKALLALNDSWLREMGMDIVVSCNMNNRDDRPTRVAQLQTAVQPGLQQC